jgi:thioredoxin reductase (NADPH)
VRVVGHRWSERSHEIKTFLARNHVPYRWLDVERDAEALRISDLTNADAAELPLVLVPDGDTLRGPSLIDLADALGLRTSAAPPLYDLCIVCGGPDRARGRGVRRLGGAADGRRRREAPGGQAGQSSRIENYLGFPNGLSGFDLAQRALGQARRFGAELVVAREVESFQARGPVRAVCLSGAGEIEARALLVATGVSYRWLEAPGLADLTGRGVYYGASARACTYRDQDVYIVGARTRQDEAALDLAASRRVVLVVRSNSLEVDVALPRRADRVAPNIEVRLQSRVVAGRGDGHLRPSRSPISGAPRRRWRPSG